MDSKKLEELYKEYCKIKGMADGGEVEPDDALTRLGKKFREAFKSPPTPAPKEDTQEDKYEKIRRENQERMSGDRPSLMSMDPDHKVQGFADGSDGEVEDPRRVDLGELEGSVIAADPRRRMEDLPDLDSESVEAPYENEELGAEAESQPAVDKEIAKAKEAESSDEEEPASKEPASKQDKSKAPKVASAEEADQASDEEPTDDEESPAGKLMKRIKPKMNVDFGEAQGNIAQELKDAQAKRDQLLQGDQIQKNFNLIGAGINKAQPLPPGYFDSSKRAENAVKNIEEKIALQKHDPNSQISQGMRNFVEQKYGIKIGGNPSAADIEGISKPLYNEAVAELKGATQMALAQQKYKQQVGAGAAQEGKGIVQAKAEATGGQARETEEAKQKGRIDLAHLKGTIAGQMFDLKKNEKVKGASVDFYKDWVHQTGRGQPLGIAARTSIFADKLPALVNQYSNLNDVPDTLVTDANLAFANLISQGVPPANLQALLNKNNLPREPGKIWTWITADPKGANQKEMLQLLIDSSTKQKKLADAQMKDAAIPLLKAYEHKGMPPEQRKQILGRFNATEDEYQGFDKGGEFAKAEAAPSKQAQGKNIVKKGYNPKTNQTQFIYDDGSKEIKDGKL